MEIVRTSEPRARADTPAVFAQSPMHSGPVTPDEATALIYRPSRSAMTSAPARNQWRLVFERKRPSYLEPLMGWTGSGETQHQVSLQFPTLEAAVRYAERQGLRYNVQMPAGEPSPPSDEHRSASVQSFADATLHRLGMSTVGAAYRQAMAGAHERKDPEGPDRWAHPGQVVEDPTLSLPAKRSILMNWAWNEYLLDQATTEGMPDYGRASRLDEVERALLELEGGRRSGDAAAATAGEHGGALSENGLDFQAGEYEGHFGTHSRTGGEAAGPRRGREPAEAQASGCLPVMDSAVHQRPFGMWPT